MHNHTQDPSTLGTPADSEQARQRTLGKRGNLLGGLGKPGLKTHVAWPCWFISFLSIKLGSTQLMTSSGTTKGNFEGTGSVKKGTCVDASGSVETGAEDASG